MAYERVNGGDDDMETVIITGDSAGTGRRGGSPGKRKPLVPPAPVDEQIGAFDPGIGETYLAATVEFRSGSAALSADDRLTLRDVADTIRAQGGSVRVVGHATPQAGRDPVKQMMTAFKLSTDRAEAVAKELGRLGVPRRGIRAEAVTDAAEDTVEAGAGPYAEIYIEY